jgi:catechol 2,3-dioxygenase-like lactoylglutathione lyase family enzyme
MKLDGLHHVSAITADAHANLDFYGRLLGLRLIWQGANADDLGMSHIAYGDERGLPGSIVTFFEIPHARRGRAGAGMVHRLLLRVTDEAALDFWERRLSDAGVPTARTSGLRFADPEGLELELVVDDQDEPRIAAAVDIGEDVAIRGLHGARAFSPDPRRSERVLAEALGMQHVDERTWMARGEGRHGRYDLRPSPGRARADGRGNDAPHCVRHPRRRAGRVARAPVRSGPSPHAGARPADVQVDLLPRAQRRPARARHRSARLRVRAPGAPGRDAGADRGSGRPPRACTRRSPSSASTSRSTSGRSASR